MVSWNHRSRVLESTRASPGQGPGELRGQVSRGCVSGPAGPCGRVSFPRALPPRTQFCAFPKLSVFLTVNVLLLMRTGLGWGGTCFLYHPWGSLRAQPGAGCTRGFRDLCACSGEEA